MPTKKTPRPPGPDDLLCDTCPERFAPRATQAQTDERARVAGWHIYRGYAYHNTDLAFPDATATFITRILCPQCIGTNRTRIPAPPVLEGQSDILADLGVTVEPQQKERKTRKGREMS